MLQLYNTLTNQKEKFEPLNPGKVTMYVCGPTVYNYIHIGNARSAVAFDTIRRYLEYRGFEVNYVSNFTDVDDKIIKASQEMNLSVKEITEKFINAFYEDTSALNVKKATLNPRVMDNMDDIIKFTEHSICHPGRPCPQGEFQDISPCFTFFQRAKSNGSCFLSWSISSTRLLAPCSKSSINCPDSLP